MKEKLAKDILTESINRTGLALAVLEADGSCSFCSQRMNEILDIIPGGLDDFISSLADTPKAAADLLEGFEGLSNGGVFETRLSKTAANGAVRVYEFTAAAIEEGRRTIQMRDISTESAMFMEVEALERLASAGRVAAGVAHEFNNLLTSMLGWTQIAQRSAGTTPDVRSALETIENNTRRAKQIAGELLDVARPKSAREKSTNISGIVEDCLRLLSWELNAAKITATTQLDPDAFAMVDSTRLSQVFINIIRNAIEATPSRGSMKVTCQRTNGTVRVTFTDSGNGIPEDVMGRIFEPFFTTKIRQPELTTGGSGLGLSICKKIIEDHGGHISVASRRPGGTTITVELPSTQMQNEAPVNLVDTRSSFPPGIAVLVVDDEEDICEMIRTALTLRGAHVVSATSGQEAVEIARRENFDAAFLDFSMIGLAGLELGAAIVEAQPSLPIVYMSGVEIPEHDNPNFVDFLKKPFDLHEIQVKLRDVLDRPGS